LVDSSYSFFANGSQDSNRFELLLSNPLAGVTTENVSCYGQEDGQFILKNSPNSSVSLFDEGGNSINFSLADSTYVARDLKPGLYQVKHPATQKCPEVSKWMSITQPEPILPEFQILEDVSNPLKVKFHNLSQGATSYLWVFGDGDTSTDFSPVHTYPLAAKYEVELTAQNGDCQQSLSNLFEATNPLGKSQEVESVNLKLSSEETGVYVYSSRELYGVSLAVYTVSGKIINTIEFDVLAAGKTKILDQNKKFIPIVVVVQNDNNPTTQFKTIH
jgi:hypothetical protein